MRVCFSDNSCLFQIPKKQAPTTLITKHDKSNNKSKQITNRQTLENLHKKAQELLNISSISTTSSGASSSAEEKAEPTQPRKNKLIEKSPKKAKVQNKIDHPISIHAKYNGKIEVNAKDKVNSINVRDDDSRTKSIKAKVFKPRNDKIKTYTKQIKDPVITISGR